MKVGRTEGPGPGGTREPWASLSRGRTASATGIGRPIPPKGPHGGQLEAGRLDRRPGQASRRERKEQTSVWGRKDRAEGRLRVPPQLSLPPRGLLRGPHGDRAGGFQGVGTLPSGESGLRPAGPVCQDDFTFNHQEAGASRVKP